MTRRLPCCLLLWGAALLFAQVRADAEAPDRRALILIRALAYDRRLRERAGAELVVAVLYRKGHRESEAMADVVTPAHAALSGIRVQGLPLRVTRVQFLDAQELRAAVGALGIDVLYLCAGLEADLAAILSLTRQRQLISVGGLEPQVLQGAALGVFPRGDRQAIVVNLAASRKEGADFSPELLQLAEVLR